MRTFKALLMIHFQGMLHLLSSRGGVISKMKNKSGNMMIVFIMVISLYVSGIYSFLLGSIYGPVGMLDLLPAVMSVIVCLFSLMFTAFGASGIVFGSKDMDFMLSLPVSAFQVMLSKVMALYLENLVICAVMLLPCGVSYVWYGGGLNLYFIIALPLLTVFFSVIPTMFALIIGYFLVFINSKFGKNALLNNALYFVALLIILFFAFRVNYLMQASLQQKDAMIHIFQTWLLPLWLFTQGVLGNIVYGLIFILTTAIIFLLIVYALSRNYKAILSRISAKTAKTNYHMGNLKTRGTFYALFRKELERYWGSPIYLFNTAIGIILAIGGCLFAYIKREMLTAMLLQIGSTGIFPLLCLVAGFIFAITCPAAASISLEGKNLWILKEAPISAKSILLAKGLLNALLIWATGIVCIPLLIPALGLSPIQVLAMAAFCFAFSIFVPAGGLWMNLLFPKLDAPNEILVVKQSMSVMVSMFGGMGIVALGAGIYYLLNSYVPETVFIFGYNAVILAAGMVLCHLLFTQGEKRILAL